MQEDSTALEQNEIQERYVEELASPEDYWLTITDAARATRRQDVSIRRWISKGQLPVRRQPVGLNQRTRLVRASDLALLTPIIDPSGAISSERGRLDLTSIPVQQAQIRSSQQTILEQIEGLTNLVQNESVALRQLISVEQADRQVAIDELRATFEITIARQQEAASEHHNAITEALNQLQTTFEDEIAALQTQHSARQAEFEQQLEEISERVQQTTQTFEQTNEQHQFQLETLTRLLQEGAQAQQQLSETVLNLTTQLAEQHLKYEELTHISNQLKQQVSSQASLLSEQRIRQEQEQRAREQLSQQLAQLSQRFEAQQARQDESQQEVLGVLAQQQDQLGNLGLHLNDEIQRHDYLAQLYVNLEQHEAERDQRVGQLYQIIEQVTRGAKRFESSNRDSEQ